jgi:hypothetical protein
VTPVLDQNAAQSNQVGVFRFSEPFLAGLRLFSLGRSVSIIDNEFAQKLRFSGRKRSVQIADFRDGARA